jgi:hypothetical protein
MIARTSARLVSEVHRKSVLNSPFSTALMILLVMAFGRGTTIEPNPCIISWIHWKKELAYNIDQSLAIIPSFLHELIKSLGG